MKFILAIFLFIGFTCHAFATADFPLGRDLSAIFAQLMEPAEGSSLDPALVAQLRSYKIIMVPGFKNQWMGELSGDFADQISALKSASLQEGEDFLMMQSAQNFSGLLTATHNASAIAAVVRSSARPVLFVTQSKGSVDTLEALLEYPDIQDRVNGWFSIQGAMWGTRIADTIESSSSLSTMNEVMRLMGGDPQAIIELQHTARATYMNAHQADLDKLTGNVHIVTFASWKDYSSLWWPLRELDKHYFPGYASVQNDGVMIPQDTFLPQTDYIIASGIDHGETTIRTGAKPAFDRKAFMRTILTMLLQQD